MKKFLLILAILLCVPPFEKGGTGGILQFIFCSSQAFADATRSVSIDDRVYRAIDRLVALGVVKNIIIGQRPYSRGEVERILLEAESNLDGLENPLQKMAVYRILKYWKGRYSNSKRWKVRFLDRLDIDYKYLHGPDRTVYDNGLGTVNAHVRPLTEFESGRLYADGHNYSFETYHYLKGPFFVVFAHPRFQLQIPTGDRDGDNMVFVQELYAKFGYKNFELEAGRDQAVWGQGENGGLIFTNNARPLDFLKISNPYPLKIKYIGNFKGTIFLANFGPHYNHKYSYLAAAKVSLQPVSFTEFGFYYGMIAGGKNAPFASIDGMGGMDLRFRIPPLSGLEIYAEIYLESADLDHLSTVLSDHAAYLGGVYFPRLGRSNNMGIRFEYKRIAPYVYRSRQWPDGFALGSEFLGDPLGPDSHGIYADYYYDLGLASRLIARFAYETRGGDLLNARPSDGGYTVATSRPSENRYRGLLALEHNVRKNLKLKWLFGCEAVDNFNFASGDDRTSLIGGVNLSFELGL